MSMKINKTDKAGIDHEYNVLFYSSLFCRKTEEVSETFHACVCPASQESNNPGYKATENY